MATLVQQEIAIATPRTSVKTGPVLVACDGANVSHEALFGAARRVVRALEGPIELLGVCEPTPIVAAGLDGVVAPRELDEMRGATMLDDIRRTVSISANGDTSWTTDVMIGSPARTIADEAQRRDAALIVMGIGRHNPLDRLFGAETTLATLRESSVPVLAVGSCAPSTPVQVVVGMDFTPASIHAAHLAVRLMDQTGHLMLVHVRPRFEHPSHDWQTWDNDYGRTLPPLFEQLRSQLGAPSTMRVESVVLRGDPAPALLAFSQQHNADMIAVGKHRRGLVERLMVGSVATRILRTARCAILASPSP